jgi:cbb3-type cytochrome oxidase maturation protein
MIYYAGWLFLVAISLGASLAAFIWALRADQFSDQERARYLPLGKDLLSEPIATVSRAKSRAHTAVLWLVTAVCLIAFAAALTLGLYHR